MKSNYILYQQHIMWYESQMINETLDSLQESIKHSNIPVKLKFCLNSQTLLEKPIEGKPEDMFKQFLSHPVLKRAEIIYKTDKDEFYNIGDWRREIYDPNAKYTVWGESDCLIPEDYFYILSEIEIQEAHILSLSSRIMWDDSWTCVEHESLQRYPDLNNQKPSNEELQPYRYYDYITQDQLNSFNEEQEVKIVKTFFWKVDGSLLSLSKGLKTPFIAPDLHFVREDTCAEWYFRKNEIPQYHITTRIKGHNYYHPLKRVNTLNTRDEYIWKQFEAQSNKAILNFIK